MPIPTITALPTAPSRTTSPTIFTTQADALLSALPTMVTEENASIAAMNTAVTDTTAAAAVAVGAAGAIAWVSGTTYVTGNVRYSPVDFLAYRRKTNGAGTTDPSSDTTNWALAAGSGDVTQTGTQTLTNKTIAFSSNTLTGVASTAFAIAVAVAL